ncbi:MAG: amino acid adenylation domain-containing protein [Myxococcota bacterium]
MSFEGTLPTLVELVRARARHDPHRVVLVPLVDGETAGEPLTYQQLDRCASAVAADLAQRCPPGSRALLVHRNGSDFIIALFACFYADVIAVPAYPPRARHARARLNAIIKDAEPAVVLTDVPADVADLPLRPVGRSRASPPSDSDAPALLQYTSGSTAQPKGVCVTHRNLVHNQAAIARAFGHDEASSIVSWLPVYHDMGLSNLLQAVYVGIPCFLMAPAHFLQRPARWLEAIARHRATTSGGPDFAYELCSRRITPEQRRRLDLGCWRVAYDGSEPVRAQTLQHFVETFGPQGFRASAFRPCYGLAEATLLVAAGAPDCVARIERFETLALTEHRAVVAAPGLGQALVSCGSARECEVIIADPDGGRALPTGRVGEIWVQGPSVAAGYWQRPEETATAFGARVPGHPGTFLRTGDLGFVTDGELYVAGRLKDLIVARGQNHHPADIERTAQDTDPSLPVGGGAAFGLDVAGEERVVVVHEVGRATLDATALTGIIRRRILEEHGLQVAAVVLIRPGTLPRTTSGKVRRAACRDQFVAGTLVVVSEWRPPSESVAPDSHPPAPTPDEVLDWFATTLADRLGVPAETLDVDQPLGRYAVDSLAALDLAHRVTTRFGVVLPIATIFDQSSISSLAAAVCLTLEAAPPRPDPALVAPPVHADGVLTRGQRAIWIQEQLGAARTANLVARAARIHGPLDPEALRRALRRLVARHPALRTTFEVGPDGPVSRTHPHLTLDLKLDYDAGPIAERLRDLARRPFDLQQGPLLRVHMLHDESAAGRGSWVLLLVVHHIVVDFWSFEVIVADLAALYASEHRGAPAVLRPPGACAATLPLSAGEASAKYWEERLAGAPHASAPPADLLAPRTRTHHAEAVPLVLDEALTRQLDVFAATERATPYMILLASLAVVLHHNSGAEDVVVGSPTVARSGAALGGVVGCFLDAVAIRGDLAGDPSFRRVVQRVREAVVGALEHRADPHDHVGEHARPGPFDVLLVWLGAHHDVGKALVPFALQEAGACLELGGLRLEALPVPSPSALFALELVAGRVGHEVHGSLAYATELYAASTATRLVAHLSRVLRTGLDSPDRPLSELSPVDEAEQRVLLHLGGNPEAIVRPEGLYDRVAAWATATPDAIALTFDGATLTYAALHDRSRALAHRLQRLGVLPGRPIAVLLEDGPLQVTALLAVLAAGACFVCVDIGYPALRLERILDDLRPSHVLTSATWANRPARGDERTWVVIGEEDGGGPEDGPLRGGRGTDAAYVVYTSGSGGSPKGIVQSHAAFNQFLDWQIQRFHMGPGQRIAQWATLTYDAAYCEIFGGLCSGATVCLAVPAMRQDPSALLAWVEREAITLLQMVPSFWRVVWAQLADLPPGARDPLRSLEWLLLAGEALPVDLARSWLARYPAHPALFNLYGPSETVLATCYPVEAVGEATRSIPIGRPIDGRRILLLTPHGRPCPRGAIGEIYVQSRHLTIGYHGRPEETARAWLPAPGARSEDDRMYRTGDLARWTPQGELEFHGRIDGQLKMRGVRVELEEVAAVLRACPLVEDAVVVADEDGGGDPRILAYVAGPAAIDLAALREAARRMLPPQAVPTAFVRLDALPRTRTGKIDRRALPPPAPAERSGPAASSAPWTDREKLVAAVWQEVLGVQAVGVDDRFMDLGGHSLSAMQVVGRLRRRGWELPLASVFEAPSVAGMAARIQAVEGSVPDLAQMVDDIEALSDDEVEALLSDPEGT